MHAGYPVKSQRKYAILRTRESRSCFDDPMTITGYQLLKPVYKQLAVPCQIILLRWRI